MTFPVTAFDQNSKSWIRNRPYMVFDVHNFKTFYRVLIHYPAILIPNMSGMMVIMLFGSPTCPGWWWLCYLDPLHVRDDGDYVIWIPNMSGMMVILLFGSPTCPGWWWLYYLDPQHVQDDDDDDYVIWILNMSGMMVIMLLGSPTCLGWWWLCYLDPQHVRDDGDYVIWIALLRSARLPNFKVSNAQICHSNIWPKKPSVVL